MNGKTMKAIVASLAGMAAITLSACGGGGGSGNSAAPAPVAQKPAPIVIDMEGDSLIWGYSGVNNGVAVQSPNNPPGLVQAALQKKFGPSVTTQNNAVPGTTAADSMSGQNYPGALTTRLASNSAQIVLGDYVMNDSVKMTVDAYAADLTQWVRSVKASGKIPVLEEPNPSCAPQHANLPPYRDAMVKVAAQENVLLIQQYDYILSLPNWQGMLMADCVHPTDALYAIKAQREAEALEPLVAQLPR